MMIRLVTPSEINEIEYKELVNEFTAAGEDLVPNALEQGKLSFRDHIKNLEDYSIGLNLPENYVPATTYFLIDHFGRFIGATNVRHKLNGFLRTEGGHIAYGIRPSSRQNGYGTKLLGLALEKAKELNISPVLIICDKNNHYSSAVIQKNGGILEAEARIKDNIIQRFWIKI